MTTTIRVVYSEEPKCLPTDQHPEAKRIQMFGRWIDYVGDDPTPEWLEAALSPPPPPAVDPVEKLVRFLAENPDVDEMVSAQKAST